MEKQPLEETFNKVAEELQKSVDAVMLLLQEGMQKYLSNSIDIKQLLKVMEKMGLANVLGITKIPIVGFDYYKILGLEKTASNSEIKERYLKIMAKIHPDISGKEMTFLSALVNTAYGIISKERGI